MGASRKSNSYFPWKSLTRIVIFLKDITCLPPLLNALLCFGGSDIKKEKLETLKKAGAEVLYLSFDPDIAGKKATRDTIKYSEELGLCCFIMELPEGYDPYEYIKTYGLPAYQKIFKSACKPSEWLAKEFLSKYLLNTKEGLERAKIALLEEAKQYKGLILEAFLEETTRELKQDKNYILELVKKQQQESAKGIALFTLKSFLPDAPVNEDFLIPIGWSLDNKGLIKIKETKDDILEIPIAAAPFFVSSRSVNIDTKQEKLELTYLRDKKWKTIYEERAILLDHRKIVQLAGLGFPVTSLNCKEIVHFISDFEGTNDEILPKRTTISGFGWKKEKNTQYFVMPEKAYGTDISIVFEPEGLGDGRLAKALRAEGNLKDWKIAVRRLLDHPRAMFHLYASLTPPLLELIDAPNFIIDNWGLTSIGKTTIISIAASIWGLPIKEQGGLIVGWDATKVSIERLACLFNHLPIFLDDSQTAKEKTIENILYMIANGVGRLRGALKGTQKTSHWRTVAFSTGEKALNTVTEYEGAKARIISLYGSPFGEKKEAELIHKIKPIINSNFGFAGPCFLSELINKSHNKSNELLRKEYRCYTAKLAKLGKDNVSDRIAQYLGAVQVAGRIAEDLFEIGGEPEKVIKHIFRESIGELKEAGDYPQRALDLIISWVQSNQNSFDKSDFQADVDRGEVFGIIRHGEYIGIFPHKLKELLNKNKFSYSTILKAFKDRNWIQTSKSQNTYPIGFRSKVVRMIKLQWKSFIDMWE